MDVSQNDGKMEGWLYIIRSNRFGLKFLRKRYFILRENYLKCFKTRPISQEEKPLRSANIDSYIRITDTGRESINRKGTALLQKNLDNAKASLEVLVADLQFLRDQVTITQVTIARVYNWDVHQKRRMREAVTAEKDS